MTKLAHYPQSPSGNARLGPGVVSMLIVAASFGLVYLWLENSHSTSRGERSLRTIDGYTTEDAIRTTSSAAESIRDMQPFFGWVLLLGLSLLILKASAIHNEIHALRIDLWELERQKRE